ncbi:SulP family inorganic anion transporter [Sphaerotilus mobilis]|uniref:SulP family sulfate permease n=1 Tax=Sphaerotilus mobilis TaxID=47994 RepID=A0A4Q7LKT4_9BURK|nr:SulP family inorganic anion transporter [Sphaerotilus mobilis]RZS54417.1 SulP family sulfate permease [Sphaerotilus mobilis]
MAGPTLNLNLHRFRPRLAEVWRGYDRRQFGADAAAGLTVGVVALPLAMAFAIASGVKPEQGLITAIVAGFLISALGGSQVQIGGPAGAFIVIVYGIVERYGLANLLIATMLAGVLLLLMGWFKLGALVRYIPVSIVIGFTNGIAVLIGLSQVKDLFGLPIDKLPADFLTQLGMLAAALPQLDPLALLIGLASLAVVALWPKSYRMDIAPDHWRARISRVAAHVPGTLVVLVGATLATAWLHLPVETIGTRFGAIPQALPPIALPALSWASAKLLLIPTVTIALLGAIESLLCARVADNLADHPRHDPNQELMAQGVANLVTPLFGGIPATGTIARTVTNVRAGARTPVAGMVHAGVILAVMLVAAPLAQHVPLAALAGILLFVAWNMGEWRAFAHLRQFNLPYRTTLLGTFVLTVVFDLTVAVEVGLLLACGFFIWRMSQLFSVDAVDLPGMPGMPATTQVRRLQGALFFGAVGKVEGLETQLPEGTTRLVLDLDRLFWLDTSGVDTLRQLHRQLGRVGIALVLVAPQAQARSLIQRSGLATELGPAGLVDRLDPVPTADEGLAAGTDNPLP